MESTELSCPSFNFPQINHPFNPLHSKALTRTQLLPVPARVDGFVQGWTFVLTLVNMLRHWFGQHFQRILMATSSFLLRNLPRHLCVGIVCVTTSPLWADDPGPVAGVDGIRLYWYEERKSELSTWRTDQGVGPEFDTTTTNRWERTIGVDWTLMTGGTRRFVERSFWESWTRGACGDGIESQDNSQSTITGFTSWSTNSSVSYTTFSDRWVTPCQTPQIQGGIGPSYADSSIQQFVGTWTHRRDTNGPTVTTWYNPPPNWESGSIQGYDYWNQTPRIQLTTSTSPYKGRPGSFFWIRVSAHDLIRNEPIPNNEIRIAGKQVTVEGRALVYSRNNAGYNQMVDVTPSIPTRKTYRFNVSEHRSDSRTGAVQGYMGVSNPLWPGPRPTGMVQRMQYSVPSGSTGPTDDQILWDVLSNSPLAPQLNAAVNSVLGLSVPSVSVTSTQGGLAQATVSDRQWLALAFMSRSANAPLPTSMSPSELDTMTASSKGSYRLLNELKALGVVDGATYVVLENERRKSEVGQTMVRLWSGVTIRVTRGNGSVVPLAINATLMNAILSASGLALNNALSDNGALTGGVGTTQVRNTASMQGGILPAAVHDLIVRGPRRDLRSGVVFQGEADQMRTVIDTGTSCAWPGGDQYEWHDGTERYIKTSAAATSSSPFDCFLTIYP